jgi:Cu(I)/Ag(I) efflux system membrane fusion protein
MKWLSSVLIVAMVGCASTASAAESEEMKAVVAAYLDIQGQLVADKLDTVKTQARTIGEQAGKMGKAGEGLRSAVPALEQAADIKSARDAFGPLSEAVIAAARADGWANVSALKLAYCPMAKRSWLQSAEAIQNPYYGKAMATCGEFRKMQ